MARMRATASRLAIEARREQVEARRRKREQVAAATAPARQIIATCQSIANVAHWIGDATEELRFDLGLVARDFAALPKGQLARMERLVELQQRLATLNYRSDSLMRSSAKILRAAASLREEFDRRTHANS